jgi:hypothetical protein
MNKLGKIFISRSLKHLEIPILGLYIKQHNFSLAYYSTVTYLGNRREQDSELNDIRHFIRLAQTLKELTKISSG